MDYESIERNNFDEWNTAYTVQKMIECNFAIVYKIEEFTTIECKERKYICRKKGVYCEIVQTHFIPIEWDNCLKSCACDNMETYSR